MALPAGLNLGAFVMGTSGGLNDLGLAFYTLAGAISVAFSSYSTVRAHRTARSVRTNKRKIDSQDDRWVLLVNALQQEISFLHAERTKYRNEISALQTQLVAIKLKLYEHVPNDIHPVVVEELNGLINRLESVAAKASDFASSDPAFDLQAMLSLPEE